MRALAIAFWGALRRFIGGMDRAGRAERRARELEATAAVAATIGRSSDLRTALDDALGAVRRITGLPVGAVYRLDRPVGDLVLLAAQGWAESELALIRHRPVDGSLIGAAVRTGCAEISYPASDPALDPRYRAIAADRGHRVQVALPIPVSGEVWGLLVLVGEHESRVETADLPFLDVIARQVGVAVERASLLAETDRRRREAEVLAELARAINATLDLDATLQRVADGARRLCDSERATIILRDPESGALHRRAVTDHADGRGDDGAVMIRPGSLGARVLQSGQPARTDDAREDSRLSAEAVAALQAAGVVSRLVVPIRTADAIEGLMFVDNGTRRPFTDADESVLVRLADQAAVAIRNAQIFDARVRAEQALRESERLYRLLAENSADVIAILDTSFQVTYVSPSVQQQRGYTPEEVLRQPLEERLTPASREVVLRAIAEDMVLEESGTADPARTRLLEIEVPRKGGGTVWTETTITSLRDASGRRTGFLVVSRNISERKRAEAELREREEQLRQAQKMEAVGRLAGGIAHDFNNLLTVIIGRTDLLVANPALPAPLRRDVHLIYTTAERAAVLTRQLLAFSRRQILQPRLIDLRAVVDGILPMLGRVVGEDVEIRVRRARDAAWVEADPGQLEQVIMNLVVNARDAMPGGGHLVFETATCRVDVRPPGLIGDLAAGEYAVLSVSDTGGGMDDKTLARIFEPFFTTKEPGKGTGLGLAMVYGIVRQSRGDVAVESAPRGGSTFRIYLPRAAAPPEASPDEASRDPEPAGAETILLVEDEGDVRELVRELLELQGYTVLDADQGSSALRAAETYAGPIDLLLTDMVMPGMRGDVLARLLTDNGRVRRVLFMSGYNEAPPPKRLASGSGEILRKPFVSEELIRRVRETLDALPR